MNLIDLLPSALARGSESILAVRHASGMSIRTCARMRARVRYASGMSFRTCARACVLVHTFCDRDEDSIMTHERGRRRRGGWRARHDAHA